VLVPGARPVSSRLGWKQVEITVPKLGAKTKLGVRLLILFLATLYGALLGDADWPSAHEHSMDDPFAARGQAPHAALREHHQIPLDVYYPLVEGFLRDERYTSWALGNKPWQLHCFGNPGCGKVKWSRVFAVTL
jgi:hypothetical protein